MGWISGPIAGSILVFSPSNMAKTRFNERSRLRSFLGRWFACGRRKSAMKGSNGAISHFGRKAWGWRRWRAVDNTQSHDWLSLQGRSIPHRRLMDLWYGWALSLLPLCKRYFELRSVGSSAAVARLPRRSLRSSSICSVLPWQAGPLPGPDIQSPWQQYTFSNAFSRFLLSVIL